MSKLMKCLILSLLLVGTGFAAKSWTLKSGSRTAIVYAPDQRDNPALVISMHGMGLGTWWTPGAMKFEALADTANFVVVYPEGENSSWDIGGNKDVNFIVAIIDSMYNRYQIDRNRVYATGFSMGGMMSWHLSCKIPDKIAAIVPGNGYPLGGMSGCSEVRHVPALQIHGTADDFVSYSGFVGNFMPAQRARYGCPETPVKTMPYPTEVNGRNASQLAAGTKSFMEYYGPCEKDGLVSEISLLSVDGMIHDWATPDKASTNEDPKYTGKPLDVNGTWEAWNFMKKHSLNGAIPTIPSHRDSIYNGDFMEGSAAWKLNVWDGEATGSVVDEEYQVKINSIGTSNYQIQLIQKGLILEQGKYYEVSFNAYAASNRTLEVNVEKDTDPWTSYLQELQNFDLTTSKSKYTFSFGMEEPTDSNSRLSFNVGASTETVFLDQISMKSIQKPTAISSLDYSKINMNVRCENSFLKMDFKAPQSGTISFSLFDLKGNQMKVNASPIRQGENQSWVSDLSPLPKGMYVVQINVGKTMLYRTKIVNIK